MRYDDKDLTDIDNNWDKSVHLGAFHDEQLAKGTVPCHSIIFFKQDGSW